MPRGKIGQLSLEIRKELDRRLIEGDFQDYRKLAAWLGKQGCTISSVGVSKYRSKLEQRLALVKLATGQAKEIVEASGADDYKINEALLRLVQQQLFAALVELEPSEAHAVNVAALARSVAQMGRVTLMYRKFTEELKAKVIANAAAAEAKVAQAISLDGAGGLTPVAREAIRRALMAIAE